MSACGSPFSSNRRIEPAVAVKASERPGRSSVCLVVESGGSLCCSAVAGDEGALPPRAGGLPFCPAGAVAAGLCGDGSSARALTKAAQSMIKTQMVQAMGVLRAMIYFLPAFGSRPKKCRHDDVLPGSGWKLRHVHGAGKAIRREAHQIPVSCPLERRYLLCFVRKRALRPRQERSGCIDDAAKSLAPTSSSRS